MENSSESEALTALATSGSYEGTFKDVTAEGLLNDVCWIESSKVYKIWLARNGSLTGRIGKTPQEAAKAGAEWHLKMDAMGVPKTLSRKKKLPSKHQSGVNGVSWEGASWLGIVFDRLTSANVGKQRYKRTRSIYKDPHSKEDIEACRIARDVLVAEEARAYEEHFAARVAEIPHLHGLPRTPAFADAEFGKVYVHAQRQTTPPHEPYAVVLVKQGSSNLTWTKACRHDDCTKMAIGINNQPNATDAKFCVQHGGGRRCPGPLGGNGECPLGVAINLSGHYEDLCMNCFCNSNPNDPKAIAARSYVHAREQAVVEILKKTFQNYNWVFDKSYGSRTVLKGTRTSTVRCRPDARFGNADRVIIVEIDEDSHRAYLCVKEREREASFVAQAGRESTVVMIRFNPDKYIDLNGVKHPTCFLQTKVNPKQMKQWEERMQTLINTIRFVSDPEEPLPPKQDERPCLMVELFYDNISKTPQEERLASSKQRFAAINTQKRNAGASAEASTSKAPKTA